MSECGEASLMPKTKLKDNKFQPADIGKLVQVQGIKDRSGEGKGRLREVKTGCKCLQK